MDFLHIKRRIADLRSRTYVQLSACIFLYGLKKSKKKNDDWLKFCTFYLYEIVEKYSERAEEYSSSVCIKLWRVRIYRSGKV